MEKKNGFEYMVKGFEDIIDFAKGILTLTNAKSSRKDTVIDIRTYEGTNLVKVISLIELDSELTSIMGEIQSKSSIEILELGADDLKPVELKIVETLEDNDKDMFFVAVNEL